MLEDLAINDNEPTVLFMLATLSLTNSLSSTVNYFLFSLLSCSFRFNFIQYWLFNLRQEKVNEPFTHKEESETREDIEQKQRR
jgi:hypothetical protein